MGVSDLSTCTTHSHHTGLKVDLTLKPENGAGGQGAVMPTVGPGQPWSEEQGAENPRKLLDLSCFRRLMLHFQTAQKLVVYCKLLF